MWFWKRGNARLNKAKSAVGKERMEVESRLRKEYVEMVREAVRRSEERKIRVVFKGEEDCEISENDVTGSLLN